MRLRKIACLTLCLGLAGTLAAQEFRATISGLVADASGAPIPQAHVTITNVETNVANTTTTNSGGVYTIPYLSSGSYKIAVDVQGFDSLIRQGITLHVDEQVRLDFTMKVGAVKETVTITGAAPLINTATALTSGQIIDKRSITGAAAARRQYIPTGR